MIEIALQNEGWPASEADWQALAETAIAAALAQTPWSSLNSDAVTVEVSLCLTDNDSVQSLNRDHRGKDKPTNVLSFPMMHPDDNAGLPEILLGDIVLALGVCTSEAEEKGVALSVHASHLIVHGVLHLLGYDHMVDEDATQMEMLERRAMADLGLPDPYQD